jgi:hypothetical protein
LAAAANVRYFVGQLAVGTEAGLAEASVYCQRVLAGNVAIVGTPPPPKPELPVAPPIKRVRCMLNQNSRWREPDGSVKVCARYGIADLPHNLAEHTIAAGLAVREDSDLYRRLRASDSESGYGCAWGAPLAEHCLDLDTGEPPKAQEQSAAEPTEWTGPAQTGFAVASPSARW